MKVYSIFRATGATYYCRITRRKDGQIWDSSAEALSAATTWANSALAMTEMDTEYRVTIPAKLPNGTYDITVYQQAGASPASSDSVDTGEELKVREVKNP